MERFLSIESLEKVLYRNVLALGEEAVFGALNYQYTIPKDFGISSLACSHQGTLVNSSRTFSFLLSFNFLAIVDTIFSASPSKLPFTLKVNPPYFLDSSNRLVSVSENQIGIIAFSPKRCLNCSDSNFVQIF